MARGLGRRAARRRKRPSASTRRPSERLHARCQARRFLPRCQTGKPTVSCLSKLDREAIEEPLHLRDSEATQGDLETPSPRLLLLVLLGKAYPANHAPGIEIAGELVLIAVARNQHDDAPLLYVLQVYGGRGTQIAREGFRSLDHYLLADPRLGDLSFRVRGAGSLAVHHSSLL